MSSDDANVTYTVKELLGMMEQRADERHAETKAQLAQVEAKVGAVAVRVSSLEKDRTRRVAITGGLSKVWVAAIALMGVLVNLPGLLYYIHGGTP